MVVRDAEPCPWTRGQDGHVPPGHACSLDWWRSENPFRATAVQGLADPDRRQRGRSWIHPTTTTGTLHDHKTFDLTSVLYAIRPNDSYFSLSPAGRVSLQPNGVATFKESSGGNTRLLTVDDEQRVRTLEAMMLLVSQPPQTLR